MAPHHRPRAGYCPSSLYTADGSNIRHPPSLRCQNAQISRRLVDSSRIQDRLSPGQGRAPSSVRGAATTSQFQEIVLDPISGHDLSRHADPVSSVHCKTDRGEGRKSPQDHRGVSFIPAPPPAALWRRLLGHLSSLPPLVKGGMLRMQSLQIRLRSRWDFRDELLRIPWDPLCQEDLLWWSWAIQTREGVNFSLPVPDLNFYSDVSDVGWGAIVGEKPSVRSLDSEPKGTLHPPQGDDGSAERPLRVQLSPQRQDDRSLLRQCHDSRLPQAIGRHEVSGPVPQSKRDSPVSRIHGDHATSPVHPGVSLHESGSSQSAQPGDRIGMDATPGGGPRSSPPVAGDYRPVRDLADSKAPSVLCSSVGTQSSEGRCIPPALGQSSGICLSSHSYHKESSSQTESLSQLRSDSTHPPFGLKGNGFQICWNFYQTFQ